jgi:integrase
VLLGRVWGVGSDKRLGEVDAPLPSERMNPPRYLSQAEVERLVEQTPDPYKALILVGAYAGLRWGEAAGLTRASIDAARSRITITSTAVQVGGKVTLGHEPKTPRYKRTIPVARSVMRRLDQHLATYVEPGSGALVFTASKGGPLFRGTFTRDIWRPAVQRAGLAGITFHGLRHSFCRDPGRGRLQCP